MNNKHSIVLYTTMVYVVVMRLPCMAHHESVHMKMTESAAKSSVGLTDFLNNNVGFDYGPFDNYPKIQSDTSGSQSPINFIIQGSHDEDIGARIINHFYTVTHYPLQLTDIGRDERLLLGYGVWPAQPVDSFTWVSVLGGGTTGTAPRNNDTWQDARSSEYAALTMTAKADRDRYLAKMLISLGKILHLNQDLSQPDHTRNTQHPVTRTIERYGSDVYLNKPGAFDAPRVHGPSGTFGFRAWRDSGFQKLKDFWDRGLYAGQAGPLNNDAQGTRIDPQNAIIGASTLGLGEFCNGNFLGQAALYKEYFAPNDLHYFPFPTLQTSTDFSQLGGSYVDARPVFLRNGTQVRRAYLTKIADGMIINYHSVLTYSGVMYPRLGSKIFLATSTIRDNNVLDEYHSKLVPRAIAFSQGLLDYFFRGEIECWASVDNSGVCHLSIANYTLQDMVGGHLYLFYTDGSGNRAAVPGFATDYSGFLKSSPSDPLPIVNATFTPPSGDVKLYTLVFCCGKLGVNDTFEALDPVDQPIIAKSFVLLWYQITSGDAAANLELSQDVFWDGFFVGSSGSDSLASGNLWMGLDTITDTKGEFDLQVSSPGNAAPDHNINCTLKTFFNTGSAPVSTESFSIMAVQQGEYPPWGDPPYTYFRSPIIIDGEYRLIQF